MVEVSVARFLGAGAEELISHPAALGTRRMVREVVAIVVPGGLRGVTGAGLDPAEMIPDIHDSGTIIRKMRTGEAIHRQTSPPPYRPFFDVLTL